MKNLLFFWLFTCTHSLLAQSSTFELFYELPPDVLEQKLQQKFKLTPTDCKIQVGTSLDSNKLAAGYYIKAEVREEELLLSMIDRTTIHAILLNNERDFAVQIVDTLGKMVYPAKVFLDGKLVSFNEKTQSYRIEKHKEGKLLRVEAANQVAFFPLEVESWNNRKFGRTRLGSIVLTPVR